MRRARASCATARAARRRDERLDGLLEHVLVDAAVLVQQPERRLELVDERPALGVRQAFGVLPSQLVHHADVAGLGQERVVVHEAPERDQRVDRAGLAVVAEDAADASP